MFIESIDETYLLFCEYVENPGKRGYMAILKKIKPKSKELINSRLLDKKIEVEGLLKEAERKMKKIMNYWDAPDGIK
jgi:hypothetical protein